jgi:glycosyltransferase involved in cell wall biosynthesis
VIRNEGREALREWALEPGKYILWVGRLEPETLVEELIEAFGRAALPGFKLAIVGDAPFADAYKKQLRAAATPDVVFTGRQFGEAYQQLSCHAFAYVQTSPTSGTSPALLDQMAFGNAVIARGTETNTEVVGEAGLAYSPGDPIAALASTLRSLHGDDALAAKLRVAAIARVQAEYSWEHITDVYEGLFRALVRRKRRGKKS